MLQYKTISNETLGLLIALQKTQSLNDALLAGGTALALQLGHRKSIDLDFFGKIDADEIFLRSEFSKVGTLITLNVNKNIKSYLIGGIKVDIVNYPYPWIYPPLIVDSLKLAQIPDIAAMKLAAICNRGSKKDFFDLAALLDIYSLNQLLDFYKQKFHDGSDFLVLRSLTWFEDAESENNPELIKKITWKKVKEKISAALRSYIKESGLKNNS
ncbi:MAG: hypothetical protein A2W91_07100 [Bacteroidetes bacterium GWF2_38_335]|nr:MAG: hypothetical protein A2W91_07100 [Bacteroidetes bacterium GWF2_38_335]OFY77095.1 MAG: hypothetical protein A2281_14335 [Bacteroidetes bacterium RIFOXYA12_FULL_38_20]HBS84985.1 hypothetical protein [Bacteroidales bacterium]